MGRLTMPIKFDQAAWDELVAHVIDTEGVERMRRVADACNAADGTDQYMLSTEGKGALLQRDYRVTVITAGAKAIKANAQWNTLLQHFHLAGGD